MPYLILERGAGQGCLFHHGLAKSLQGLETKIEAQKLRHNRIMTHTMMGSALNQRKSTMSSDEKEPHCKLGICLGVKATHFNHTIVYHGSSIEHVSRPDMSVITTEMYLWCQWDTTSTACQGYLWCFEHYIAARNHAFGAPDACIIRGKHPVALP